MDSNLSMECHVASIVRSCYMGLRKIGRIRMFISGDTAATLVNAYVTSKLDCNNSLLHKLPKTLLNRLQMIQNNSARLISMKRKYDSIEPVLKDLHWLPIEFRIQYKINLLTFKCLNNLAPFYLRDLLEPYVPGRSLRSTDKNLLTEKRSRTIVGDRAFSVCAPVLWNGLPFQLRATTSIIHFKSLLKTHYFRLAFTD